MKVLAYSSIYIFPILVLIGFYLGGLFNFTTVIVAYFFVPFLDTLLGPSQKNLDPDEEKAIAKARVYRVLTYGAAPVIVALVLWSCWVVSHYSLLWYEYIGLLLSVALVSGGIGLTVAHEQCHKLHSPVEMFLARVTLMCTCYMHFTIEHVFGHHAHVATPKDPATARFGQSFYSFYPQTVLGSFKSAWEIEANRLRARKLPLWSHYNHMIWFVVIPLAFMTLITASFGLSGLVFFLAQAIVGFSYLEVINYVEHYGLERRRLANGRYEKVQNIHSWNSDHIVSNYMLFGLPRHSDHHAHATRRYQVLRSLEGSPQLPFCYPMMMPLVFFPKLWRKVMDPRVMAARQESIGL